MDLRVMDEVAEYLGTKPYAAPRAYNGTEPSRGTGLKDRYDHVAIAGAALGAVTPLKPHWNETFWDHVDLAIALHKVKKLIIIEHQDCGAYKAFFLPAARRDVIGAKKGKGWTDAVGEGACHYRMARELRNQLLQRGKNLEVQVLYAALAGPDSKHATIRHFSAAEIKRAQVDEAADEKTLLTIANADKDDAAHGAKTDALPEPAFEAPPAAAPAPKKKAAKPPAPAPKKKLAKTPPATPAPKKKRPR
ncbi:MAG: hypothetical protein KIT84_42815 [Labilithrix sp.]|nr:hypothetical protein [Labilithrix sp.]MCW5817811.1 hypothetical protein [Labilithrix sp.]